MNDDGFYVYKYVSEDGNIVYIGKSETITQRIKQHSSFNGLDEKFKAYKNAKVYIHKCSSRHEMDALEIILIEKYKPILNVSCKTKSNLSFDFDVDIDWVDFDKIKPKKSVSAVKKVAKSDDIIIRSGSGINEFVNLVQEWHTMYYFANWLKEQSDCDNRTTVEINLNDYKEMSKWTWLCDENCNCFHFENVLGICMPPPLAYCYTVPVIGYTRIKDKLWVDLYSPLNVLKRLLPMVSKDLIQMKTKIKKYTGISDGMLGKCKKNGFYDAFVDIRYNKVFPDLSEVSEAVSEEECKKLEKLLHDNRAEKHDSPRLDYTANDVWDSLFSARKKRKFFVGGAYWNIWEYSFCA